MKRYLRKEKTQMEKILVKVPEYVKQFYMNNEYKQPMANYAAMILIQYAIENGAKEKTPVAPVVAVL
jgi:hypothetical protein